MMDAFHAAFADAASAAKRARHAADAEHRWNRRFTWARWDDPRLLARISELGTRRRAAARDAEAAQGRLGLEWDRLSRHLRALPCRTDAALDLGEGCADDAIAGLLKLGLLDDSAGWFRLGAIDARLAVELLFTRCTLPPQIFGRV